MLSPSSQLFVPSSALSADGTVQDRRHKSRFTYRHISQLAASLTSCPLRVIAHIDLDAFYAQCERVRLDLPEDTPLAVQQWQGLIAINYPARKFGLNRHIDITEAKKLCPELVMQHVATWKEGDAKWAYHEDAPAHIGTHKVSLDPYRLESRKILATIKDALPAPPMQRVEKAGIDEVFLDLSAQVHSVLVERYPELSSPAPYDDPTENLPRPPSTALDWNTDALVDLDVTETEQDDPDWDDVAMLIGSEIVRSVRATIRAKLRYTCSAGVAQNKMLAKLGSAHRKPNQQTIVRNRAVQQFMSGFKFTKIRNLGGKLGDQIVATFGTDTVKDLLETSQDQMKLKFGIETGSWIHQVIRGVDHSEVNSRTQIKSMLSAKSFRPTIHTNEQAERWLRIFVADIFSRLVEEGVLENKRRPKTINLHHRHSGQMRSRQAPIPQGRPIDETMLFDLSKTLLSQVVAEGKAWPCANLSLSVGGFEDAITGNRGIGPFLVKGDEAKATNSDLHVAERNSMEHEPPEKRRRMHDPGIQKFFTKHKGSDDVHEHEPGADESTLQKHDGASAPGRSSEANDRIAHDSDEPAPRPSPPTRHRPALVQQSITSFFCDQCQESIPVGEEEEHHDWHFAKDLQAEERHGSHTGKERPATTGSIKNKAAAMRDNSRNTSRASAGAIVEKGQRKLAFGR